jgi:hypothetical protein
MGFAAKWDKISRASEAQIVERTPIRIIRTIRTIQDDPHEKDNSANTANIASKGATQERGEATASPIPSNGTPGTRLDFLPEDTPLGLRQLLGLLHNVGLYLSKTPKGQFFAWGEPPLHVDALDFTAMLVRELPGELQEMAGQIPVMPPSSAHALLDRLEDAHAREGFHVLRGWRGLSIPESWPPMVGLSLQSLFLAACYGPGVSK